MNLSQVSISVIIFMTMFFFLWGRFRHDVVALGALLAAVFSGLIPGNGAFAGFGHPAVITVIAVLILSRGLQTTGAVDALARKILPAETGPGLSILALTGLAALLSGFMNNVGALALLMPAALQTAEKQGLPPGKILMPLAFGSILGGTTTLIGTPPNLIISGFRAREGLGAFSMFDFTPVGAAIAFFGVLFVGLLGWRLVPKRERQEGSGFETGAYLSEVRIPEGSSSAGKRLREVEAMLDTADAQIVGMVRGNVHVVAPHPGYVLREGDILVIEAEPESLASVLSSAGLRLEEDVSPGEEEKKAEERRRQSFEMYRFNPGRPGGGTKEQEKDREEREISDEMLVRELVALPGSPLSGLSATELRLRTRYGINLLALSRKGARSVTRLRTTAIRPGDVLLVQGPPDALSAFASEYDCLPLASRDIRVPKKGEALAASLVMGASVLLAAFGVVPAAVSFSAGALAFVLLRIVPLGSVYAAVDWSVVVLLGAMLPLADALADTGTADLIANFLLASVARGDPEVGLVAILAGTMILTDFMNNAATAAVMGPIAISAAAGLGVNPDPFLMAVAIGASCAFLTPIGHQNNTLILGPGGFSFGDYWKMGLPTDLLVIVVSVPMLLLVWPL
jgi:di/tricarboxylate transporter